MSNEEVLRPELKSRIEKLLGAPVTSYRRVKGGYTPALRLVCHSADASFFVKIGVTPLTGEYLRREIHVYRRVSGSFMPKLVSWDEHDLEPILILEDLSTCTWPPPWDERRVQLVLEQIEAVHHTTVQLESFAEVFGTGKEGHWQTVAAEPTPFLSLGLADSRWLDAALPILIEAEARCRTDGAYLTHGDLRSDNMCFATNGPRFVDWNLASLSNPVLDIGSWLPSLAYEGGPLPERILPHAPEVAAWISGFFAARAGLPLIPDAPRVRVVQRQQLETALPWASRALALPPLSRNRRAG